jgi:hypothetical protein
MREKGLALAAIWQERLVALDGLRIGLVWAGDLLCGVASRRCRTSGEMCGA